MIALYGLNKRMLLSYANLYQYKVYNIYTSKKKLLRDAKLRKFNQVIVKNTRDLSRSIRKVTSFIMDDLEPLGITFKSITQPFNTTTEWGRQFMIQLQSFADFDPKKIKIVRRKMK